MKRFLLFLLAFTFQAQAILTPIGGGTGSGTVTSVGLTDSTGLFTISGSPVTTAGNLNLAAFSLTFAANTALTGTYTYPVTVNGNASLSGNTLVEGDLIINGNLTNTGGRSLTVKGNLTISGGFLFTPSSTATAQGDVTVGGNFYFGADSDFRVNPTRTPGLTVNGSMIAMGNAFDGSGQSEATGLSVTVGSDVSFVGVNLNGGDSANVADAGAGGTLNVSGNCHNFNLSANGGNSGFNTFSAGAGGNANLYGDVFLNGNFSLNGGNVTVGSGTAGTAGIAQIGGKVATVLTGEGILFSLTGGSAISGSGGGGGQIYCDSLSYLAVVLDGGASTSGSGGTAGNFPGNGALQNEQINNCSLSGVGGAGGVNGGDGAFIVACQGACTFTSVNLNGGAGTSGNGGAGGAFKSNGDLVLLGAFSADGGAGNAGTGTGGAGGSLTAQAAFTTNSTFSAVGGTGNTHGAAGTKTVNGVVQGNRFITTNQGSSSVPAIGFDDGTGNPAGLSFTGGATAMSFLAGGQTAATLSYGGNFNLIQPGSIFATAGNWFIADATGAGGRDTAWFPNGTSDTALFTSSNAPSTTDGAGMKLYGKTSGTPSIAEFWNNGVLTAKLDASNQVFFPNLATSSAAQTGTVCSGTLGQLTVDTTTTCLASTRKIKKDIDPLDVGLDLVMKLKPVAYTLREDRGEGRQIGLVAEDVAEVENRLVALDNNGEPRSVRYQQLTAVLVKAIQEQQTQIADLKNEINELKINRKDF